MNHIGIRPARGNFFQYCAILIIDWSLDMGSAVYLGWKDSSAATQIAEYVYNLNKIVLFRI